MHVSLYISPHLIIVHLAAPVIPSTTARHRACAFGSGETIKKTKSVILAMAFALQKVVTVMFICEHFLAEFSGRNMPTASKVFRRSTVGIYI